MSRVSYWRWSWEFKSPSPKKTTFPAGNSRPSGVLNHHCLTFMSPVCLSLTMGKVWQANHELIDVVKNHDDDHVSEDLFFSVGCHSGSYLAYEDTYIQVVCHFAVHTPRVDNKKTHFGIRTLQITWVRCPFLFRHFNHMVTDMGFCIYRLSTIHGLLPWLGSTGSDLLPRLVKSSSSWRFLQVIRDDDSSMIPTRKKRSSQKNISQHKVARWWQLKHFWNFHPYLGKTNPFWLIFFWVETTN